MEYCGSCHNQAHGHVLVMNDGICNDCMAALDRKRLADLAKMYSEVAPVFLARKPVVENG